jgi:hypothetical protein
MRAVASFGAGKLPLERRSKALQLARGGRPARYEGTILGGAVVGRVAPSTALTFV